ncbi:PKD domain-containing protein [Candidatus Pacearchaeota archaeon]|nr:PKD domain-containing protein [Candidatus Pacearchaeota archaeon]
MIKRRDSSVKIVFSKNYFPKFLFFSVFISFLMILGVFAGVNYIANSVHTSYSAGEAIRGNIYLTLSNYPGESIFTSNFLGNTTLLSLIRNQSNLSEGVNYNCSSNGCLSDYSSSGVTQGLSLSSGAGSFVGFGIEGSQISVTDAQLKIISNAQSSCAPNLYVDVLDDGQDILANTQSNGLSCGLRYTGCYNPSNNNEASIVSGREYCEMINISAGPSFIVGGKIRMGSSGSNLTMSLYEESSGNLLGTCDIIQNTQVFQDLSCVIDYSSSNTKSYYICVTTSVDNNDKIGWETSTPNCGTAQGFGSFSSDFDLFAETMGYSGSPSFVVNNSEYEKIFSSTLSQTINDYIQDHYNGNCQNEKCFIPIRLYGGSQTISFEDSKINYESVSVPVESSNLYKLTYDSPKISATNLSLDISKANFVIPVGSTQTNFKLYLGETQLFKKDISIAKSFIFDITPKVVAFGQSARFKALSSTVNITSTIWEFGDGSSRQTINGSGAYHSYLDRNKSSFDLNVTAFSSNGLRATKQFKVFVGNPREIANQTILDYKKRVINITSKINSYPAWVIPKMNMILDLGNLTLKINSIESDYLNATVESEFQDVMVELIQLDMPVSIATVGSGENFPLSVGHENVNVNYLEQIENKDILDNAKLTDLVIGWMNSHFNPEISFKNVAKFNEFGTETFITLFTINTKPVDSVNTKTYLIFGQDIKNLGEYKSDYDVKSINTIGVNYVILDPSSSQTFEFLIEGDIDAESLGAYIAPSLSAINFDVNIGGECNLNNICDSNEDKQTCPEDCSNRWFKFTLIGWIILLIVGFIVYIILQEWYKRNYQKHLFPEINDLYNLVNFIYNARKGGVSDSEIKSKLRQQKWSGEKIRFAFRKIEGRRTAMFEIPLFTRREHKQIVTQISNRQASGVDARFIKRHSFV